MTKEEVVDLVDEHNKGNGIIDKIFAYLMTSVIVGFGLKIGLYLACKQINIIENLMNIYLL